MVLGFDRYSRVARVYPALLTLAPMICSALIVFPTLLHDFMKGSITLIAAACLLYLLASLARSRGKLIEGKLLKKWGGWPTTILLRHHDGTIDRHTKARYHNRLSALCANIELPTADEEMEAPADADAVYVSATKRLLEARRAAAFRSVADENASYGFRRNLFGLKMDASIITILSMLITIAAWWFTAQPEATFSAVAASLAANPQIPAMLLVDVGYLLAWLLYVNERFVRQGANEYAMALLRTLE